MCGFLGVLAGVFLVSKVRKSITRPPTYFPRAGCDTQKNLPFMKGPLYSEGAWNVRVNRESASSSETMNSWPGNFRCPMSCGCFVNKASLVEAPPPLLWPLPFVEATVVLVAVRKGRTVSKRLGERSVSNWLNKNQFHSFIATSHSMHVIP